MQRQELKKDKRGRIHVTLNRRKYMYDPSRIIMGDRVTIDGIRTRRSEDSVQDAVDFLSVILKPVKHVPADMVEKDIETITVHNVLKLYEYIQYVTVESYRMYLSSNVARLKDSLLSMDRGGEYEAVLMRIKIIEDKLKDLK